MTNIKQQLPPHQRLAHYNYVALPHDNINTIAHRFGCLPDWITQENKLKKPEDIQAGQQLRIPVAVPNLRSMWARGRRIHLFTDQPYGRRIERAGGLIHLSAIDRKERDEPSEVQFLHATWSDPRDRGLYTIEWTGLRPAKRDGGAYGGIGIQVPLHGRSGAGQRRQPEVTALVAMWGWGRLFRNGQPIADELPVHAAIALTDGRHVLDVLVEGKGPPDGFTHLQAHTVDLCMSD